MFTFSFKILFDVQNGSFVDVYCLFVNSTVRSTAFTTKDIVVSGSDDRTVKVCSLPCASDQKLRDAFFVYSTKKILIGICELVSSNKWYSIIQIFGKRGKSRGLLKKNVGNLSFRSIWFSFRNFRNFLLNALHFGNLAIFGPESFRTSCFRSKFRDTDRQLHVWRTATVNAWCSLTELKKCSFWANWMNTQVHT